MTNQEMIDTVFSREELVAQIEELRARLDQAGKDLERSKRLHMMLLHNAGENGSCIYCGASVLWVTHKARRQADGKLKAARAPYDSDGETHFATCPDYPGKKKGA